MYWPRGRRVESGPSPRRRTTRLAVAVRGETARRRCTRSVTWPGQALLCSWRYVARGASAQAALAAVVAHVMSGQRSGTGASPRTSGSNDGSMIPLILRTKPALS